MISLFLCVRKQQPTVRFKTRPLVSDSFTSTEVLSTRLQVHHRVSINRFCLNNKLFRSKINCRHSRIKKCVKKSLEKSAIIIEEKRKTVKQKNCIRDTNVYNNCFSFEAIDNRLTSEEWPSNRRYLVCCKTKFKAMAR